MPEVRLTGADKRTLLLWIFFGVVGLLFAHRYFFQAFPEASVDFKVGRSEAQQRARQFVESLGVNLAGYQSTTVFDLDENAKTYLERELGLRQANQLMAGELHIWFWEVRFFRPLQKEEFRVHVSPAGQIVGYKHVVEEAAAGASPTREEAQATAQKFLAEKRGIDLNNWDFLSEEANSLTRPNRLDWSFTWERKGFKAKDAPYRLSVGLQGASIGSTSEYLQVPEAWTRGYERLRSSNIFYNQIAILPYAFLLGAALWLGISLARQGKTSWAWPVKIGLFVAVLFALMQLNQWDSLRAEYDTNVAYSGFIATTVMKILLGALGAGIMVTLVLPAGEPLYREAQPERLQLYKSFTARALRSKEFFCATVVGLSLAAAHMGFIVAFYMVGSKLGVWAPQDLNYSDVVNTSFPWIAGVAIGVMAATSEEFLFRLFAIPFLKKFTGIRWLSIILPAFFWSFLHSAYPQEPGYIRGIEVGLIGIVAGLVMLRWGILATLTWHYTVDASLVGMLLIRSDNLYFKISGIVVGLAGLVPLAYSGISYLTRGGFEAVDDLLNAANPPGTIEFASPAHTAGTTDTRRRYDALRTGTIGFLALCIVVGGLLAWRMKREHIGDYLKVAVNEQLAVRRANSDLRELGVNPDQFRKAAQLVDTTNPVANEFLSRRMSVAAINEIYEDRVPGALWRVRYFQDSQPEEYAIVLRPNGKEHSYWHTLPEAAKSFSLSREDAIKAAENYLRGKDIDLSQWKLVEATSDKRPNRIDHTLTWQQITPLDPANSGEAKDANDHAFARIELHILGNEPADYRTYIKIPDDFARKQDEESLPRILFLIAKIMLVVALIVAVLIFYFKSYRAVPPNIVPWRRIAVWGVIALLAGVVEYIFGNKINAILMAYPTTMPLRTFFGATAIGLFLLSVLLVGLVLLLFGMAWHFAYRAFGSDHIPGWLGMPPDYYRDAFWIAVGGTALLLGLRRTLDALSGFWVTPHRGIPAAFSTFLDASYPAATVIGGAIISALLLTGVLALAGSFLGAELRVRWLRLALFLAVAAAFVSNAGNAADFARQFLLNLVMLAFIVFGIRRVARFNMLGWFLVIACTSLFAGAVELLGQPSAFYKVNGYFVLGALALLLIWPLASWRFASPAARTSA